MDAAADTLAVVVFFTTTALALGVELVRKTPVAAAGVVVAAAAPVVVPLSPARATAGLEISPVMYVGAGLVCVGST